MKLRSSIKRYKTVNSSKKIQLKKVVCFNIAASAFSEDTESI